VAKTDFTITEGASPEDMEEIRTLFEEYQKWLDVDLCFQGFDEELATLPGAYARPWGCLLLARVGGKDAGKQTGGKDVGSIIKGRKIAGGVGLRPLMGDEAVCEMKRLYVRPGWRGRGLGRRLTDAVVIEARRAGYKAMYLDTLGSLKEAIALYASMGFREIPAYYDNPTVGITYMELRLNG